MTSVAELFADAEVPYAGVVGWGDTVPLDAPGVYVVSTSADACERTGLPDVPLDLAAIETLLEMRPEATVDSSPASTALVEARLRAMWPAEETVVYIGLAGTSVRYRLNQFYKTQIGARAPHAGGWPVKMLRPSSLWVHYGPTGDSAAAESAMIRRFVVNLPDRVALELVDPAAPLPFANLTFPAGRRKMHGLRGVKADNTFGETPPAQLRTSHRKADRSDPVTAPPPITAGLVRFTQNITALDESNGQLRVPRVSKSIFPTERAHIQVELRGDVYAASWDPKTDGHKERSGVIRVGKGILANYITAGAPRRIETTPTGYRIS